MFEERTSFADFNAAAFVVRVMLNEKDAADAVLTSFAANRIDRIKKISDDISAIVSKSGITIPVKMPYDALEKKIFFRELRDGPVLDLCSVTGAATAHLENIAITVSARKAGSKEKIIFTFSEKDILWSERKQYDAEDSSIRLSTSIPLIGKKDPFGDPKVIMDIPVKRLEALLAHAKANYYPSLDLTDWQTLKPNPAAPKI